MGSARRPFLGYIVLCQTNVQHHRPPQGKVSSAPGAVSAGQPAPTVETAPKKIGKASLVEFLATLRNLWAEAPFARAFRTRSINVIQQSRRITSGLQVRLQRTLERLDRKSTRLNSSHVRIS